MKTIATMTTAALALSLALVGCGDDDLEIGTRVRTTAALRRFDTCSALEAGLRQNMKEEMRVRLLQYLDRDHFWGGGQTVTMADNAGMPPAEGGSRQEGVDFSGTNNQESGVDESDFVKTDGYYIYVLNGDRLEILGVPQLGELNHTSSTTIEGRPTQLLVSGDRAIVYSTINTWSFPDGHPLRDHAGRTSNEWGWWYRVPRYTKLTVLDIDNRYAPRVMRELYLEGSFLTARKVDSSVRMVSYAWIDIFDLKTYPEVDESFLGPFDPGRDGRMRDAIREAIRHNNRVINATPLADFLPQIYERFTDGSIQEHPFTRNDCAGFSIADDGTGRGFTSILSLDLLDDELSFDDDHILTNTSMVYSSTDTLIIAERANDWWWFWRNDNFEEASNLHRFDISGAGTAQYTGSGRVDGTILDQFSISEFKSAVRVTTTSGQWNRWWMDDPDPSENHVFVLAGDHQLNVIGHVGGIAMGERIFSTRFDEERAYMVTFRQIDPLWTIDLSQRTAPRIIGELEVPGVSTYIHPLDGDALLTIGFGGNASGLDGSTQISLFDVSDFSKPRLADGMSLSPPSGNGWSGSWSEATFEHKAFQYWAPAGLLAVPVSAYQWGSSWYEYYSRLELIKVDAQGDLRHYGSVDHSDFYNSDNGTWWVWTDIRRSIFMGDFIYAISDRGVTAHRLSDMTLSASVALGGTLYDGMY